MCRRKEGARLVHKGQIGIPGLDEQADRSSIKPVLSSVENYRRRSSLNRERLERLSSTGSSIRHKHPLGWCSWLQWRDIWTAVFCVAGQAMQLC